jgi:hypothetical protein
MRFLFLLGVSLLCFTTRTHGQLRAIQPKTSAAASDALGPPGIAARMGALRPILRVRFISLSRTQEP